MSKKKPKYVHLGDQGDGRNVRTACDGVWGEPLWEQPDLPEGVYMMEVVDDDGNGVEKRLYTFTEAKITCVKCCLISSL